MAGLGSPTPFKMTGLSEFYDPQKAEAEHEAHMLKIKGLEDEYMQKLSQKDLVSLINAGTIKNETTPNGQFSGGLENPPIAGQGFGSYSGQIMPRTNTGPAPQTTGLNPPTSTTTKTINPFIDEYGQVNINKVLESPEGKVWSQKYPDMALQLMKESGMMGAGKGTSEGQIPINSQSDIDEIVARAKTPETKMAANALRIGDVAEVFGTMSGGYTKIKVVKETPEQTYLRLSDKTTRTPEEQKKLDNIVAWAKLNKVTLPTEAAKNRQDIRTNFQTDQYAKLDEGTKAMLFEDYLNTGHLPAFVKSGMMGINAATNLFYKDVAKYAIEHGIDPKDQFVRQAVTKTNTAVMTDINKKAANISRAEAQTMTMLDYMSKLNKQVQSAGIKTGNEFIQWAKTQGLDPKRTMLYLYLMSGGREYMKVVTGSAQSIAELSQTGQEQANKIFNPSFVGPALDATISAAKAEIKGTGKSWDDARQKARNELRTGELITEPEYPLEEDFDPNTGEKIRKPAKFGSGTGGETAPENNNNIPVGTFK